MGVEDKKIERAMRFYLMASRLKDKVRRSCDNSETLKDRSESIAEEVYDSCILAVALESELDFEVDLPRVLKMLVLREIGKATADRETIAREKVFGELIAADEYTKLLEEYDNHDKPDASKEAKFAYMCTKGKRIREAFRFYDLATQLKNKIRSGWDKNHWNISKERLESVAEHVYSTCILAISFEAENNFGVNLDKVIKMIVLHEIGETIIGDQTPFDGMTPEEKKAREHAAWITVLGDLIKKDEYYELLEEFDNHNNPDATIESIYAYYCDKYDADCRSKQYQDQGYHNSLDDQTNNVVFKSPKALKMLEDGAETPFDIWEKWDRKYYNPDTEMGRVFLKGMDYLRTHNTNI